MSKVIITLEAYDKAADLVEMAKNGSVQVTAPGSTKVIQYQVVKMEIVQS